MIRAQIDEIADMKADLQRQLAKANGEIQNWQSLYQSEGLVKVPIPPSWLMKLT